VVRVPQFENHCSKERMQFWLTEADAGLKKTLFGALFSLFYKIREFSWSCSWSFMKTKDPAAGMLAALQTRHEQWVDR